MYKCESCRGEFAVFVVPDQCPLCKTWAHVRCEQCHYTGSAKQFIDDGDRCPKCNASRGSAPLTAADRVVLSGIGVVGIVLGVLVMWFLCFVCAAAVADEVHDWEDRHFISRAFRFCFAGLLALLGPLVGLAVYYGSDEYRGSWWFKAGFALYSAACAACLVVGWRESYRLAEQEVLWSIEFQRDPKNGAGATGSGKYHPRGGDGHLAIFVEHAQDAEEIHLSDTRLTDSGLKHLTRLPKLRLLKLDYTTITDRGLRHLHGLTTLQEVSLIGTKVTPEGVQTLQQARPELKITTRRDS